MKISIPRPKISHILIKEKQKVDLKTPFYKKNATKNVRIPLSSLLGFPPEKIFIALHKLVGEKIEKGDLLAEQKGMFGMKEYISEYEGIISEINHHDGSITISTDSEVSNTINCYFVGTIEEINDSEIIIAGKKVKEYSLDFLDKPFGGEVFYYDGDSKSKVTEETVSDKIVCGEEVPPYDMVKVEALGAVAFITLRNLRETSSLPRAKISNIDDFEAIFKERGQYCVCGAKGNKVIFYNQ